MVEQFRAQLWNIICTYQIVVVFFLSLNLVLLFLSLIALPFASGGSGAYVVLQLNFVVILTIIAVTSFLLYRCKKR